MWAKFGKAALVAAALGALHACATIEPAPLNIWPQQSQSLRPDAAVIWGELPSGLRYAVMPNKTPTRSVALRLHIASGSLNETDAQQGLAHFLEHMAFNGSKNVPEGDMVKILERYGLAFGPDTNAFTSFDQTVYQLDLPNNNDEIVDKGLLLLNETARNLTLAPDAIDRERGVILSELRLRDTPNYRAYVAGAKFVMPDALLTRRLPIGQKTVIEGAKQDAFEELYRRGYRPDRAIVVVTGDVDPAKIVQKIKAQFGDWTRADPAAATPSPGPAHAGGLDAGYFYDPEVKTTLTFTFVKPARLPRDSAAERKRDMARELANAIVSRRLRALARQGDAKILGGTAYFDDSYHAADLSVLVLSAESKNWRDALIVGEQELRRALTHGFSAAEVQEQLAELRSGYKNAAEYAPTRKTSDLADAIVGAAHDKLTFTHPADDLKLFESFAKTVSARSLSGAFRTDWAGVEPKIFLATSAQIENPKEALLSAYKEGRAKPVKALEKRQADAFAYTNFGVPGPVVERKVIADLAPGVSLTEIRFANNVRLNLVRTAFERDTVRASVRVCCGELDLADKPAGFPTYLESIFALGGLEKHSADELERLNAGRTADFGLGVDENAYRFSGVVTPGDLEWQLQVWAAELTAPGYRPEAQAIFQKNIAVWLDTMDATPQSVLSRELPSILRSGDPRWTIPGRSDFETFKLDDVRAALAKPLASGALEISLVGDVDETKAIEMVARTLGALPLRDAAPQPRGGVGGVHLPKADGFIEQLSHAGPKNRAAAVVAWPVGDFPSDTSRARRMRLLSSVLELKLTDDLRERLGDTYSPSVIVDQSEVFKDFGVLQATIDLEPAKLDVFYKEIDEIARDLVAGKISQDEFDRAQRPIVEGLSKSEEQNEYWLRVADEAQSRPETLDWHRSRKQDYQTATLAQIRALAKEVLKDKNALKIEVVPAE